MYILACKAPLLNTAPCNIDLIKKGTRSWADKVRKTVVLCRQIGYIHFCIKIGQT